jgi:hypothetical protein
MAMLSWKIVVRGRSFHPSGVRVSWCFLALKLSAQPSHPRCCDANPRPLSADMAHYCYKTNLASLG